MIRRSIFKIIFIIALGSIITYLHFSTSRQEAELHGLYQHLYYIPIILGGFWFGIRGGIFTSLVYSMKKYGITKESYEKET